MCLAQLGALLRTQLDLWRANKDAELAGLQKCGKHGSGSELASFRLLHAPYKETSQLFPTSTGHNS